jgi:ABC-type sugar transport system, permease component
MIANSLKSQVEYMVSPFTVDFINGHYNNYKAMVTQFNIFKYFSNTFVVDAGSLIFQLALAICASYAFAKLKFRGQNKAYLGIMIIMFIPAQIVIIPMYVMFSKVGLIDNLWGILLRYVAAGLPGTILLLTSNFRGIPSEMIEAGRIDGCGYFKIIRNIVIPMGLPAISICVIINFIGNWNELFTPMILIKSSDSQLIMPALTSLVGRYSKDVPFQLTGLLLASVPAILIYLILQKKIVMGVSMGSIK